MKNLTVSELTNLLLKKLGYVGPNFEGTPERVERMWQVFKSPVKNKLSTFPSQYNTGFVLIKNHECWSFCPHHLLPVKYTIKMGYLPKDRKVLGLSKLARICDQAMVRMPLQEELGGMIVMPLVDAIDPLGAGAVIKGEHLCMRMRGVESSHVDATTDFMYGVFLDQPATREEFLLL